MNVVFPRAAAIMRTAPRVPSIPVHRYMYSTSPSPAPTPSSSSSSETSSSAPSSSSSSSTAAAANAAARSKRLDVLEAIQREAAQANKAKPATKPPSFSSASVPYTPRSSPSARSSSSSQSATTASPTAEDNWRLSSIVPYTSPITTTSARSFQVRNNDVARAYRSLNRTLMENNVRKELRRQERFESGSDRRVRLNSERHRRRFKVAVGKAVGLAVRMKDMQ